MLIFFEKLSQAKLVKFLKKNLTSKHGETRFAKEVDEFHQHVPTP